MENIQSKQATLPDFGLLRIKLKWGVNVGISILMLYENNVLYDEMNTAHNLSGQSLSWKTRGV